MELSEITCHEDRKLLCADLYKLFESLRVVCIHCHGFDFYKHVMMRKKELPTVKIKTMQRDIFLTEFLSKK